MWFWVRVRTHGYEYGYGYGYETMGTGTGPGLGPGPTCQRVMDMGITGHGYGYTDTGMDTQFYTRVGVPVRVWVRVRVLQVCLHTTLYGSAAGCRSIQKTYAFWKNGLTFENTQSQLTYFCKSNINQTFTNGNGMTWGVMIAIFTEIRHLVEELITFLYFLDLRNWAFWQLD